MPCEKPKKKENERKISRKEGRKGSPLVGLERGTRSKATRLGQKGMKFWSKGVRRLPE